MWWKGVTLVYSKCFQIPTDFKNFTEEGVKVTLIRYKMRPINNKILNV
jgi:hypothetical protein